MQGDRYTWVINLSSGLLKSDVNEVLLVGAGILTAKRVQELSSELDISFGDVKVIANKVTPEIRPILDELAARNNLKLIGYIPYDPEIARFDAIGKPIIELPEDSPASIAVTESCQKILGCTVS